MTRSSQPEKPVVIGLGEILWDLLPDGKQLGGAPANFAYHAAALGAQSYVVSSVGRDESGDEIVDRLETLKLSTRYIARDDQHPTGTVSVTLDSAGVPSYVIHRNVAWDNIADSDELRDLARRADVTCFGTLARRSEISRRTIHAFLDATPTGALRICDVNLRQKYYSESVVRDLLRACNVLKLNEQELPVLAELLELPADESGAIAALLEQFHLHLIALTRGSRGSSLYTPRDHSHHHGFPANTSDTVGAGDAFTAALAMGLFRRRSLDEINSAANRIASFVCSQPGATPAIPDGLVQL